jgi:3-methyladenine DNA glycosylase Tag
MDPVTIIGGATVAFNAIKQGISVGRDLQDMGGQLTKWAGQWKSMGGSVEAEAIEIFAAKRKAEAMRKELKDHISFVMGPSAWEELVRIEGKIRKQKKEQEYRKAEIQEAIITWTITGLLLMSGIGAIIFFAWLISNG